MKSRVSPSSLSLRWKITAAFGTVILLAVLLSGILAFWFTAVQFDILITDQSGERAEQIAPLLEASYATWGSWDGLDELFESFDVETIPILLKESWESGIDWWGLILKTSKITEDELLQEWERTGSLASAAEAYNIDPNIWADIIIESEEQALSDAVIRGEISPREAEEIQFYLWEAAQYFIFEEKFAFEEMEWDVIAAKTMDIPIEEYYELLDSGFSVIDIADQYGKDLEAVVATIVKTELKNAETEEILSEEDKKWAEAEIKSWVYAWADPASMYKFSSALDDDFILTNEGEQWLLSTFLNTEERLLVVDPEGYVVYDSQGIFEDEILPADLEEVGAPLWSQDRERKIGTAVIAAGEGYYDVQETAFLDNTIRYLGISGLAAGTLALLIGWVFARQVTAPVTALTLATGKIAQGEWAHRLDVTSTDELGQMSAAFNTMAEDLQTQKDLRSRLVNNVAHELNTPLSIIQLELEALNDGMQAPDAAVRNVRREIDLLHNLVNDLALLAATDEGVLQLQRKPTDISALVAEEVARWKSHAEADQLQLTFHRPKNALPQISVDALRITQALGNLIANAIRHTPAGGDITLLLEQVDALPPKHRPPSQISGPYLLLTIKDTGEGIPESHLHNIFERFYRADPARSRNTGGRGLGLAIVRQIIEMHQGSIWVESEKGKGSTFGLVFPLQNPNKTQVLPKKG
jgi:signal transduction histidine kinase